MQMFRILQTCACISTTMNLSLYVLIYSYIHWTYIHEYVISIRTIFIIHSGHYLQAVCFPIFYLAPKETCLLKFLKNLYIRNKFLGLEKRHRVRSTGYSPRSPNEEMKRQSNPYELESQTFIIHHVGAGNWAWVAWILVLFITYYLLSSPYIIPFFFSTIPLLFELFFSFDL